ncbi:MAG: hypothetical protein IPL27_22130 [Lewinellaceae bacterium]|nr:hypothetical protein [Lewinellaceae bacterium]
MNQTNPSPTNSVETSPPPRTSIGVKLPLIMIGLMLFAFMVYTYISIRISEGSRTENVKEELQAETMDSVKLFKASSTKLSQLPPALLALWRQANMMTTAYGALFNPR